MIITAGPPGTIRLRDKVERRRPGTVRVANNAGRLQFRKFSLGLLETKRIKVTDLAKTGGPEVWML